MMIKVPGLFSAYKDAADKSAVQSVDGATVAGMDQGPIRLTTAARNGVFLPRSGL